uniref:helix-hairpin-helix domain-containing protein n=1 Tax=Candidatus Electrothrix sp. TaxID=2170559 RepID=UPI00405788E7
MKNPDRATVTRLEELPNISKKMAADLQAIGMNQPQQLIGQDAFALYNLLCAQTGTRHDPCVLDVFMAVIDFMEGGEPLPWWSFTTERKKKLSGDQ